MELSKHKNYKYTPTEHYKCEFRKATKEEIEDGRKKLKMLAKKDPSQIGMRSCYECNQAHAHLMEDFVFQCFDCGKYFVNGVDIMDYTD